MRPAFKTSSARCSLRSAGFTLLEVLIALIIAAIALAELMRAATSGINMTRTATRYEQALVRARSHLDVALHEAILAPRENQGDDGGGFDWRVRIAPFARTTPNPPDAQVTLYAVSVWIAWHDGDAEREVELDTRQVGTSTR